MGRPVCGLVVVFVALGLLAGCRPADSSRASSTRSAPPASAVGTPSGHAQANFPCQNPIATSSRPEPQLLTVLGAIAYYPGLLRPARSGGSSTAYRLFAKQGLDVRAGIRFTMRVPRAWRHRAGIAWGNVGNSPGPVLRSSGCPTPASGHTWLTYPGGVWVARPACVPVIVSRGDRRRTIHFAVGAPCAGRQR